MQPYLATSPSASSEHVSFTTAVSTFSDLVDELQQPTALEADHAAIERQIDTRGREVLRLLFEGWCNLRARQSSVKDVTGEDGIQRTHHRHVDRAVGSIFGEVAVVRDRLTARGSDGRVPADAALNLPEDRFSFGVRQRVAEEAARGSFDAAVAAVRSTTGSGVAKRQAEALTLAAAVDFESFYRETARDNAPPPGSLLVLSADGKGVVMRPEGLRERTRSAAAATRSKLKMRLSKGEKSNRKRMATVAAVYDIDPVPRSAAEVTGELDGERPRVRPRARHKRVFASIEAGAAKVVDAMFEEAARRDPRHEHRWVALVDGNKPQIQAIHAAAAKEGVEVTLVLDVIHVIEYLWKAAWDFFAEGAPAAEPWVGQQLGKVLRGHGSLVAAAIRRSATARRLKTRKNVDRAANYLLNNRALTHYDEYLRDGLPIATGVIEGACRHLVKDRMDITGARWGLKGAEAVLRLRALRASGDLNQYWAFHRACEFSRNHRARYADGDTPWLNQLVA